MCVYLQFCIVLVMALLGWLLERFGKRFLAGDSVGL